MYGNTPLFLVAYDSSSERRRSRIRSILKETAVGRQRSVYEHFLNVSERRKLLQQLSDVTEAEDNVLACAVDPRSAIRTWGLGHKPPSAETVIIS